VTHQNDQFQTGNPCSIEFTWKSDPCQKSGQVNLARKSQTK